MNRQYLLSPGRRAVRHVQAHGSRALVGGVSASGILAGFLSATDRIWPLLSYIAIALATTVVILVFQALHTRPRFGLPTRSRPATEEPRSETPGESASTVVRRRVGQGTRGPDPVYEGGLRVLLDAEAPLVVIPSNRRDVGNPHELSLPLFTDGTHPGVRTLVHVDPREFGIPLAPYGFQRELPDGVHDTEHTLAVKDLVYVPELAAELQQGVERHRIGGSPVMLPEHCVDPMLLAERDVVVIGGPDTNFWHGALFEPVLREFTSPRSPVPLALSLRADDGLYGSRAISVRMSDLGEALRHTRDEHTELDERLYPTYGMVLACRNPFAAALGRHRWVVFIAGTRSLGSSGAVLGLTLMLREMRRDPGVDFFSCVPTATGSPAAVSAVLLRTRVVEQAMLRRGNQLTARALRTLPPDGNDRAYSDSYVPVTIEHLDYARGSSPSWRALTEPVAPVSPAPPAKP